MVALSIIEAANTARATDSAAGRPYVAVVAGGTSGIGMYAVQQLARTHGQAGKTLSRGLRLYILGRRASDELLQSCRELCPFGQFTFVQAKDLSLMKDVDRVCEEVIAKEREASLKEGHPAKIDLLVESQGILHFGGREDTPEGLERPMAIAYYGRARIVDRLLPLLTQSVTPAAPGHVAFVMNPQLEGNIVEADLSLRNPKNFTLRNRGSHLSIFTTFYMEALAARNPGTLALVHYYPGGVKSNISETSSLGFWMRAAFRVAMPLMRITQVPEDESGKRVDFLGETSVYPPLNYKVTPGGATAKVPVGKGADNKTGSGCYRINWDDDVLKFNDKAAAYRAKGMADTIYQHTQRAFEVIASGKKFTE
ncbi:hypothetical protein SEUCBS139899_009087 [Sporothrix eucalyptigena]|uniref:Short-chain dehydrogenase/reductase n=1 Tax=Sporothrix eucalyptigena TaxID=1812306 RepID=A0ABP0CJP6_9PEZI